MRQPDPTEPAIDATVPTDGGRSPQGSRTDGIRRWLRAAFARHGLRVVLATIVVASSSASSAAVAEGPGDAPPLGDAEQRRVLNQIDTVGRRGFLYAIEKPTADATRSQRLYLYGTVHLGRVGSEPFNRPVVAALRDARRLALEADPTDTSMTRRLALQLGRYADGDGLQHHVPAGLLKRLRAFGERNGFSIGQVDRFKPWLLANMIALRGPGTATLDPSLGSELYFSGFARARRLPIFEIEGIEAQLRMLAGLPDALQSAQLEETLAEVDGRPTAIDDDEALFDLWRRGDAQAGDAFVEELRREASGRTFGRYFVETLLDARNRTMADQAERYLARPGATFFAVGALHLFGPTGLLREFTGRGYRVIDLQSDAGAPR